jgi:hypothetical protein
MEIRYQIFVNDISTLFERIHMKTHLLSIVCILLCLFSGVLLAASTPWSFLDTKTIGAHSFIQKHPTFDGRGVLIVICDTGVDMGVPGLIQTSEGRPKVLDARDFSGQGDIPLKQAEIDTSGREIALSADDVRITGFKDLNHTPQDSVYWVGVIDEAFLFQNSAVPDINNNGTTRDRFVFVTFPVSIEDETRWVYYLDEDGDGNVQDEVARFNYIYHRDTFNLAGRETDEKSLLTLTLNILATEKEASLHVCDNAHGTHCAGIAAGYQIYGETGLNGVAPGAQVVSCKIGDATLSGGASTTGSMKQAYEYGLKFAEKHNMPVVFSMSYGVGSELEGRTDIESFLNGLMESHDDVVLVTSNGNEGPGLSSAGNPSGASRILSAGALLTREHARDTYGFALSQDVIFSFSSRGGELFKPDVLTPGSAVSTVPDYVKNERMWGTSMACPQLAGAAAVLISACQQEDLPWTGALIKRALQTGARSLDGYTALDQGHGVVHLATAYEVMQDYAGRHEHAQVVDYAVETLSPVFPDNKGPAAYWRAGTCPPTQNTNQTFTVKPLFSSLLSADQKQDFYRTFNLDTQTSWISLQKDNTYIRGDHATTIPVTYDLSQLQRPGLYVGTIEAYPSGDSRSSVPDFSLLNTVIVPHTLSQQNNYAMQSEQKTLNPGFYDRYFIRVPAGASALQVRIHPVGGTFCECYGYLYNPEGIQVAVFSEIDPDEPEPIVYTVSGEDLVPGTWEVIPYAYYDTLKPSHYWLEARCYAVSSNPDPIPSFHLDPGSAPRTECQVTSHFGEFSGTASGSLDRYQRTRKIDLNTDIWTSTFEVGEDVEAVNFTVSMDKETWNLFTDVAINIRDEDDLILEPGGMVQRKAEVTFAPESPGTYTLEVAAGFTYPDKVDETWSFQLTEAFYTTQPVTIQVTHNNERRFKLYPDIPETLTLLLDQRPRIVPEGFQLAGDIIFQTASAPAAELNVRIDPHRFER